MKKNVGKTEKIIRIILAVVIAGLGFFFNIWWLYLLALVPLLTGLFSYCPLYSIFKKKANKKK